MKHASILIIALLYAACAFDPGGLPGNGVSDVDAGPDTDADAPDAGEGTDADPGTDAASPAPTASITCTSETIDGYSKIVMTFGGDIVSGFLGDDPGPGAAIDSIEYGSSDEDAAVAAACLDTWAVPYPSGCTKHSAVWGAAPRLILEPEADKLNVVLHYHDGSLRWGDLKTADGDGVGFTVTGLDCRIEVDEDGDGGLIRTKP